MSVVKGNIPYGQIITTAFGTSSTVKYLIISNKGNSLVVINLFIKNGAQEVLISPKDMEIKPNEVYTDRDVYLLANENILLKSTGNIDYYFSIL